VYNVWNSKLEDSKYASARCDLRYPKLKTGSPVHIDIVYVQKITNENSSLMPNGSKIGNSKSLGRFIQDYQKYVYLVWFPLFTKNIKFRQQL